ncbi:MAG: hypothetical protein HYU75_20760 [Betaproteobacteria bacterium]|nr:hypothetical protein [Betaproteobacteria bacterium]
MRLKPVSDAAMTLMHPLQRTALGVAALGALAGAGCIAAFVAGRFAHVQFLIAAGVAAGLGVAALLVGVLVAGRRAPCGCAAEQASEPLARAAQWRRRQKLIDERLNIDEPHLCSQYRIACTCWSLCGGPPQRNPAAEAGGAGGQGEHCARTAGAQAGAVSLPVIFRRGRDDCQFRFQSPLARRRQE